MQQLILSKNNVQLVINLQLIQNRLKTVSNAITEHIVLLVQEKCNAQRVIIVL